eukprot:XP_020397255.1 uncharacterized protein LOC109941157 [Zea mays]
MGFPVPGRLLQLGMGAAGSERGWKGSVVRGGDGRRRGRRCHGEVGLRRLRWVQAAALHRRRAGNWVDTRPQNRGFDGRGDVRRQQRVRRRDWIRCGTVCETGAEGAAAAAVGVPGANGDGDTVWVSLPDLTADAGLSAAVGVSLPDLTAGRGSAGSGGRCVDAGVCRVRGRARDRGHPPRPDRDPRAGFEGAAAAAVGVPGADGDGDGDAVGVSLPDLTAAGVGPTTGAGDGDGGAVEVCGVLMGRGGGGSKASMAGNRGARARGTVDPWRGRVEVEGCGGGRRRSERERQNPRALMQRGWSAEGDGRTVRHANCGRLQ